MGDWSVDTKDLDLKTWDGEQQTTQAVCSV